MGNGYLGRYPAIERARSCWGWSEVKGQGGTCTPSARCSISAVHLVTTKGTSSGKSLGSCRKLTPKRGVRAGSRLCPQRMSRVSRQRLWQVRKHWWGEGYRVREVTGGQQGKGRLGSLGNGKLMGNHQIRAIPRDRKVTGISGNGGAWSQGGHGGQQRALGHRPRPHLLTLGPADHEGLTLAALGWASQPP